MVCAYSLLLYLTLFLPGDLLLALSMFSGSVSKSVPKYVSFMFHLQALKTFNSFWIPHCKGSKANSDDLLRLSLFFDARNRSRALQ